MGHVERSVLHLSRCDLFRPRPQQTEASLYNVMFWTCVAVVVALVMFVTHSAEFSGSVNLQPR